MGGRGAPTWGAGCILEHSFEGAPVIRLSWAGRQSGRTEALMLLGSASSRPWDRRTSLFSRPGSCSEKP